MKIIDKKNKVLVLGADGMLGNAVFRYLKERNIDVSGTSRKNITEYDFFNVESFNETVFTSLVERHKPQFIINCIGYIRPNAEDLPEFKKALLINSIFPQNLSIACCKHKIRLIHFSTDCVFSGEDGPYKENDQPDETSLYGVTKLLGEVRQLPNITIRTSLIGRELRGSRNLLDWFLATQEKEINGYKNVLWNGISTITAAKIIYKIIVDEIEFEQPLIQIASETVSKYELLNIFKEVYSKDVVINEFLDINNNRTLIPSSVQEKLFPGMVTSLKEQIEELKNIYE